VAFDRRRRALAAALVFLVTVIAMEAMSVAPILPSIERDLGGIAWYGWVFAAFALAEIVAIPICGEWADRANPAVPLAAGIGSFIAGLVVASSAGSMPVLVGGRVLQGLGAGAVPAIAYVCVGRGFPEAERPRMFALMSTAWVVPSVVGPAAASFLVEHVGWRWVFGGLIPVTAVAGGLALAPVSWLGRPDPAGSPDRRSATTAPALVLVVGATAMIAGFQQHAPAAIVPLCVVGLALTVAAFARLTPSGTLRLAAGVPAAVLLRGALTFAFFGAEAFLPLTLTDVRGTSTAYPGVVFACSAFAWTGASWLQARWIDRLGPRLLFRSGLATVAVAIGMLLALAATAVPVWTSILAWSLGGFGIGLAYSPLSLVVLARAEPGREGFASAAVQLSDSLGVAVGTGLGGAVVAVAERWGRDLASGIGVVFAATAVLALAAGVAGRRVPTSVSETSVATPGVGAVAAAASGV
jgi:MFS family permease